MAEIENDNAGVIAPPPLIYAGPLLLGLLLRRAAPAIPLPRQFRRAAGAAMLLGGMGIAGWAAATMRRAGTPLDPRERVEALVSEGPFRYSRNPLYLSLTLAYAGIALLTNTLPALIALPGVLAVMQRGVIAREESYLKRRFGASYADYRARVRRWL
jgi:protein-S-isoprenylcysteine O-methyltransferase Ste14